MAPSNPRTRRFKQLQRQEQVVSTSKGTSLDDLSCLDDDMAASSSSCSTPKAQKFRISERLSCPPAPMKRRVAPKCSSKESSINFFAPPDIELFFFFAFSNITTLHSLQK
ncbi:hypothetical protein MANES_09G025100v8 [Manihot esculenta]|uniref:Uncharacterized protein n=1 Tax=Manihot esculenta TaxID=3983 RepID=A0A2C9V7D0_MANES|nr:hypothetical protein MANES_09G025100v8 [Manihot esculenta]